jgi:DNA (cytosine-5)-methyltransferase 1
MKQFRLLDLFCGAGGAAMGYHLAGFEVVGVDIKPQKNYPFEFRQGDALDFAIHFGYQFDFIHASPPCLFASKLGGIHRAKHLNLIPATQKLLGELDKPYIIENVEDARGWLTGPIMLCGTMFGLNIYRHRYFETSLGLFQSPATCGHLPGPVLISGTTWRNGKRYEFPVKERREAIGCAWMTDKEVDQAIPPVFTHWLGLKAIEHLQKAVA